ncbi:TetR/AcrR family transcriptional regulator [Microbacterium chocolatum]|uniref:TetR/AcrR family transcriptional regulator n=1 Tax=Microbacterium aurantiacum TaxID=162393 RepID=UPI00338F6A33
MTGPLGGRPRASSREVIAEAACELFLERGYADTSVADIAARAGVSRSSFFNYFTSKSAILWADLDARIDDLEDRIGASTTLPGIDDALQALGRGFAPGTLALALAHAEAMRAEEELVHGGAVRAARIARSVSAALRRAGHDPLVADVAGAADAGAVIASITAWTRAGAGRIRLEPLLARALAQAGRARIGAAGPAA